jgi:hypothetical protein
VNEAPSFKDGIVLAIPENSDTGANAGLPVASSVSDPDAGATFSYSSQKIKLEVRSEGCDDKGKTSGCGITTIRVDGEQVSRKQRGHNVVTLDETTGEVLSSQAFDTYGFKEAGMALRSHLESIEDGRVVIVATQDSANRYSHFADDAMRSIGAGPTYSDQFRASLAHVGIKGIFGSDSDASSQKIIVSGIPTRQAGFSKTNVKFDGPCVEPTRSMSDPCSTMADTPAACADLCEANPSCKAWTTNNYKKCRLMRSVSKESNIEDEHGQVSGKASEIVEGERCLATDAATDKVQNVSGVYLRECDEASDEQLWFTEHGKIKSAATGLCVDVDVEIKGKGVKTGAVLTQRDCRLTQSGRWKIDGDTGQLINLNSQQFPGEAGSRSGKPQCLDVTKTVNV